MRRVNTRMDAFSRESYPREELFRLEKKDGELILSPNGGRGIYIHKSLESIERLKNAKMLEKRFGVKNGEKLYEELKEAL